MKLLDEKALGAVAELACARAKKKGASAAAARIGATKKDRIVLRDGKKEEVKSSIARSLTIKLYVDGRYASHSTSVLDDKKALERFIDDAVEMTRLLAADAKRQLPDPKHYAGRSKKDLGLYVAEQTTFAGRVARAKAAHDAARTAAGDKLLSVGAGASDYVGLTLMRTTNGFADSERSSSAWVWASVSIKDPSGRRPSDWDQAGARGSAGLSADAAAAVGKRAAERTLATLGADKAKTMTLPVIVENRAVGRLLYGLFAPLSGWALDQKRSCFEDAIGKVIASSKLDLIDDPLLEGAWGSRRFDGEGLTARRRHIVKGGKLAGYYLDSYYARKLGKEPTGGGRSNIVFSPGEGTLDALLKAAGKAVLVTNFLGGNSNSTTGDFSHGISGFVIEGGKRARPIASMNIAGNHGELWKTLTGWGADAYAYSSVRAPSLVFAPMVVSGK